MQVFHSLINDLVTISIHDFDEFVARKELQGFDPIHPNKQGHRLIAEILCPSLPDNWDCDCEALRGAN